jgi:hypothetical protein
VATSLRVAGQTYEVGNHVAIAITSPSRVNHIAINESIISSSRVNHIAINESITSSFIHVSITSPPRVNHIAIKWQSSGHQVAIKWQSRGNHSLRVRAAWPTYDGRDRRQQRDVHGHRCGGGDTVLPQ